MTNVLMVILGMIILVAGVLALNTVPGFITATHKNLLYLTLFLFSGLIIGAAASRR